MINELALQPYVDIQTPDYDAMGFVLGYSRLGEDSFGDGSTGEVWKTWIDAATNVTIRRGGVRTGLGIKTDVGICTFTLRNAQDPLAGGTFEPGQTLRVMAGQVLSAPDEITFSDDFSAPLDLDDWTTSVYDDYEPGTHASLSVTGGKLRMEASGKEVYVSAWTIDHDLWGGFASVKLTHNGGTSRYNDTSITAYLPSFRRLYVGIAEDYEGRGEGTFDLYANFRQIAPIATLKSQSIPYDPEVHRYIRVRETGGTLEWQHSVDGSTWTTFSSYVHGLSAADFLADTVDLEFWGGQSNTGGAPQYPVVVTFDDFKVGVNAWSQDFRAPIFTGRITDVAAGYPLDKQSGELTTLTTVTAADAVKQHVGTTRYGVRLSEDFETFESRINRLAESSKAPIVAPVEGAPVEVYSF